MIIFTNIIQNTIRVAKIAIENCHRVSEGAWSLKKEIIKDLNLNVFLTDSLFSVNTASMDYYMRADKEAICSKTKWAKWGRSVFFPKW